MYSVDSEVVFTRYAEIVTSGARSAASKSLNPTANIISEISPFPSSNCSSLVVTLISDRVKMLIELIINRMKKTMKRTIERTPAQIFVVSG
jgi:hypothetical protein